MSGPSIEPGLMLRYRAAGEKIAWRPIATAARGKKPPIARIAHLHDEEARVESTETKTAVTFVVDSGPVGALVLLLEIDRRGEPMRLRAVAAGTRGGFDQGALEATWSVGAAPEAGNLPISDLVGLARYALA